MMAFFKYLLVSSQLVIQSSPNSLGQIMLVCEKQNVNVVSIKVRDFSYPTRVIQVQV